MPHDVIHDIRAILVERGLGIEKESRNNNDNGQVLKLKPGPIVNVYDTGKVNVQGTPKELVRDLQETINNRLKEPSGTADVSRKIFVVYGHDRKARTELENILHRLQLEPLILDQLPSEGQTVIEKIEHYRNQASYAVVLATPDDEGHVAGRPDEKAYRARQNVVLELGMLLGMLGRPNVAILLKSSVAMERPSDIQGLIYIPFHDSVEEAKLSLAKEINARGPKIDFNRL